MTRFRLRFVAPLFAFATILVSATAVLGHAQLTESDPAAGASVSLPYTLVLRFDEALKPVESSVLIRDANATVVAQGSTVEDNFTMAVDLADLPAGAYQAHWVAITADDNGKTQGDVSFNIVAATPPPSATPATSTSPRSAAPSTTLPPDATPTPTQPVIQTPAPSAVPPTSNPQAAGAELIFPLVLAGAVAVAVAWLLLRRRQP